MIFTTVLDFRPSMLLVLTADRLVEYIETASGTAVVGSRSNESLTQLPTGPSNRLAICSIGVVPAQFYTLK